MKNIKFLTLILILGFFSCNEIKNISNIKNSSEKNIKNNLTTSSSITPSLNPSFNYNNEVINLPQSLYVVTSNNIFIFDKNGKILKNSILNETFDYFSSSENKFIFYSFISNNRIVLIKYTEKNQILRVLNINDNIKKDFIFPKYNNYKDIFAISINKDKIFFTRNNKYFFINESNEEVEINTINYYDLNNELVYKTLNKLTGKPLFYTSKNNIIFFDKNEDKKDKYLLKIISDDSNPEISLNGKYLAYPNNGVIIRDLNNKIDKQIYTGITRQIEWIKNTLIYTKYIGYTSNLYKYNIETNKEELINKDESFFYIDYESSLFYYGIDIISNFNFEISNFRENCQSVNNYIHPYCYFSKNKDFVIYEKETDESKSILENVSKEYNYSNPDDSSIYKSKPDKFNIFLYDLKNDKKQLLMENTLGQSNFSFSKNNDFVIYDKGLLEKNTEDFRKSLENRDEYLKKRKDVYITIWSIKNNKNIKLPLNLNYYEEIKYFNWLD
ncbi:MAG: hypothetical protein U0457_19850 [Candidatus Sericytochromatia bacterium]